jgi:hypothetical protein
MRLKLAAAALAVLFATSAMAQWNSAPWFERSYSIADEEYYGAYRYSDVTPDDAYCSLKYRSYDPESGTYLGYDGRRHPCP